MNKQKVVILSGSGTNYLAKKIAKKLGIRLTRVITKRHNDGELEPSIAESINGAKVFIIQSTFSPAENFLELLLLIDAAKRAGAAYIIVVTPYYGYGRGDKKDKPRIAIAAKLMASLIERAGANHLMAIDLHADQIQGFFDGPVDNLFSSYVFIPYVKRLKLKMIIFASPDTGGTSRAGKYTRVIGGDTNMVICYKARNAPGEVEYIKLIGDVKGRDVILVDDIIDTATTICKAADLMMENGARSVRALCTHAVLSKGACEKIMKSKLVEVVVTDTIPLACECKKVKVVTTVDLLANAIKRKYNGESISGLFVN